MCILNKITLSLVVIGSLFWGTPLYAAVAFNNGSGYTINNTAAGTLDGPTMTTTGAAGEVLICMLSLRNQVTAASLQLDAAGTPQSLTFINKVNTTIATGSMQAWAILHPTAVTSKAVTATWTGTTQASLSCLDVTGGDTASITTTVVARTAAQGTSTGPTVAIATQSGNMTVDGTIADGVGSISAPTPQTEVNHSNGLGNGAVGMGYQAASTSSNTHGWTLSAADKWAIMPVDIVAAGNVVSGPANMRSMMSGMGK